MKKTTKIVLIVFALVFVSLYLVNHFLVEDLLLSSIIESLYQVIGGMVFVVLMYDTGYKLFRFKKELLYSSLIVIIPGLIIGFNNFPISAYLNDRFIMNTSQLYVYLYLLQSFTTAFFEEVIFRGIIFFVIIQRLPNTKDGLFKAIIISSAIFGLTHLLNLTAGAGITSTLLQVAYSFLMGMMWAVVFIKTRNILYPIILHGVYNFFGNVLYKTGTVINRYDTATLVITSVLAVLAIVYYYLQYTKIDVDEVTDFSTPFES